MTKAVASEPLSGPAAPNPATLSRPGNVALSEGRPWAGDRYDQGAVSDPGQSFASFGDGGDIEAWLDKGDDGVLVGWLRDGDDIFRYSDPEAWAIDIDGAGIQRTDGGSASLEGEQIPDGGGDDLAAEGEEMLAEASTDEASIGDEDPSAFVEEDDDAVEEGDPTAALEDPTNPLVEDVTGDGGPDAQGAFADLLTDDTLPNGDPAPDADATMTIDGEEEPLEFEDATEPVDDGVPPVDPLADPPVVEAAGEPAAEEEDEVLTIAPDELPTTDDEDPEGDEDEDEEDQEDQEGKKNRPFERKHLPGEHDQENHGNRLRLGAHTPRARTTTAAASPSGATGGRAPAKVAMSKQSVAALSDEDLEAIMEGDDFYDYDTMAAAATELDTRNPLDDKFKQAYAATEPGSLAEHKILRDVIPAQWLTWAATNAKASRPESAVADREDEWLSFAQAQYLAAQDFVGTAFFRARFSTKPPFSEFGFFDGSVSATTAKKYMSRELAEWWDTHGVTKSEFMAEFSDSAKARGANTKRTEMYT